jgi:integrase
MAENPILDDNQVQHLEQVIKLLPDDKGPSTLLLVSFGLQAGLRLGEALSLTCSDVAQCTWRVFDTIDVPRNSGSQRTVPVDARLQECIASYLAHRPTAKLFVNAAGQQMTAFQAQYALWLATYAAGLRGPGYGFASMRRTFLARIRDSGECNRREGV